MSVDFFFCSTKSSDWTRSIRFLWRHALKMYAIIVTEDRVQFPRNTYIIRLEGFCRNYRVVIRDFSRTWRKVEFAYNIIKRDIMCRFLTPVRCWLGKLCDILKWLGTIYGAIDNWMLSNLIAIAVHLTFVSLRDDSTPSIGKRIIASDFFKY